MNAGLPQVRGRWAALAVATLALVGCLLLGWGAPRQALLSYLFAFLFFTGLSVGSLALAMVHVLTGGAWGFHLRPYLLAAARALPLQALMALPLLIGVRVLYPWASPELLAHDAVLRAQSWYLNPYFFIGRTIVYFAAWLALLAAFERRIDNPRLLPRIAAAGLIVYALTATLAAVDWVMSLLPHWHSTVFGMTIATGWMLAAAALATLCATAAARSSDPQLPRLSHDLGNLLLMFVLVWSYLAFMQYLTVWIADLPAETSWYIPRTVTTWRLLAWFLIAFHFAVPFTVLLSRRAKRRRTWLAWIAALLLLANLVDALWLVAPDQHPQGLALHWTDLFAPLGLGALWLCVYIGRTPAVRERASASLSTPYAVGHIHG
jgi:hypothetical protein